MPASALCSIGVFHDGSYVSKAQLHYYHKRKLGWLDIGQLHRLIESEAALREATYERHHVVYAGWYQGISSSLDVDEKQLRRDRDTQRQLLEAGAQPTYLPMQFQVEKGVDVALAIDAFDVSMRSNLDLVALVTGDGDFVPLVWSLRRLGIRVLVIGFEYEDEFGDARMDSALRSAASYSLSISELESERGLPESLFGKGKPRDDD